VVRLFPCLLSTDTAPPNGSPTQAGSFLLLLIDPRRVTSHGRGPRGLSGATVHARCPANNSFRCFLLSSSNIQTSGYSRMLSIISCRLPKDIHTQCVFFFRILEREVPVHSLLSQINYNVRSEKNTIKYSYKLYINRNVFQ